MNYKILILVVVFITMLTFSYGFFVGQYKIFPYEIFQEFKYKTLTENSQNTNFVIDEYIYEIDPGDLIQINSKFDVLEKRDSLINYIWKNQDYPKNIFPSNIDEDISDEKLSTLNNLKSINKLVIEMEYGVNSIAYLLIPEKNNEKLIIYHHGHGEDFRQNIRIFEYFLERDYSVLAFSMPLSGMNNQPTVEISELGIIKLINHNRLKFLENQEFSPIKFFVEPIIVSLNYVENNFEFDSYHFVGISGGGWTGIIYSAIDDRVSDTFSIAGSLPLYLRADPQNFGDYEQELPSLYSISNYLELYVLGGYGQDRKLIQIFNKNDPCCFAGEVSSLYSDSVKNVLEQLSMGYFDVLIDENDQHNISDVTLEKIHQIINS